MNIGISSWSYFGDNDANSPSGANFYMSSIILECKKRNWKVFWMMPNRDKKFKKVKFINFLPKERQEAYKYIKFINSEDSSELDTLLLDILLIEWRWPIEGRNSGQCLEKDFTPDLLIQNNLLEYYKNKSKIIIWDQDYKLDDQAFKLIFGHHIHIIETSVLPKPFRTRCHVPFNMSKFIGRERLCTKSKSTMVYIGNNYERSEQHLLCVHEAAKTIPTTFYGNWLKNDSCVKKYPFIKFKERLSKDKFETAMKDVLIVPLLAKKEYFNRGFMTARILEALYFGALPLGFRNFNGIEYYILDELIIDNEDDIVNVWHNLRKNYKMYLKLWKKQVQKLEFMDVKYFVDLLERI